MGNQHGCHDILDKTLKRIMIRAEFIRQQKKIDEFLSSPDYLLRALQLPSYPQVLQHTEYEGFNSGQCLICLKKSEQPTVVIFEAICSHGCKYFICFDCYVQWRQINDGVDKCIICRGCGVKYPG